MAEGDDDTFRCFRPRRTSVTADSFEEVTEIARECPGVVMSGSSGEVREIHSP